MGVLTAVTFLPALAAAFHIPATTTSVEHLATDLAKALAAPGPSVVVLPVHLRMFAATHEESGEA